jgi:hypothetical protein
MNQRVILPRLSRDEATFAVVEFSGRFAHELLEKVRRAVRQWATTEEGRKAIETEDFNVGDLSHCTPAGNEVGDVLGKCLGAQGIAYLDIETDSAEPVLGWDFDTPLL